MSKIRSYGFLVREEKWADNDSVVVKVLAREHGAKHPINPRTEGEDHIWDAPKKTDGMALSDLEIRVYLSSDYKYISGADVRFDTARFVNSRLAKRLLKTMTRIDREIAKTNAREVGDVVMAVAKAIGATWTVEPVGTPRGSFYSEDQWRFTTVERARDLARDAVAKLQAKLVEAA
jgi:hypothetical protein